MSSETGTQRQRDATVELSTLVDRYRIRAHRHARGHYLAGKRNDVMHTRLGFPAIVLSAVVGSTIFATASSSPNASVVVSTGIASVAAAVLVALQTFFKFSERAGKHRTAGAEFAALKRNLDVFAIKLGSTSSGRDQVVAELEMVTDRFNQIQRESPDIPDRFYDQARREQEEDTEGV